MSIQSIARCVRAGLFAGFLAMTAPFAPSAYALDDAQKTEIEALIRSYILENPEILLEAQEALEKKRAARAEALAKKTLQEQRDLIFASKNQFEVGNPDADITVVEFFDYNCGFCKRALKDMNRLLDDDPKLKFVLKELPILSEASVDAHRISFAVGRTNPDKYAEFHRKLLGASGQKDGRRALKIAGEMGLDTEKLVEVSRQEDINDAFREANMLASKLGMNGTPSYVIGEEVIFGALGYDVLKEKIANMRECGATDC